MEENTNKEESTEQSKQNIQRDALGLWENTKTFLIELLDFRHDTDRTATLEAIKADIPFKGATAWILIFAVFVASIGLNANSTAVVIGAMLISPLMGPILGVGMSFALNDINTLKKSVVNLVTMIVLSLLASFLFFYLFPLSEDTSELLGRTKPDIRDVLIAFFGGLALMVARTKKGTVASVIFGVAIATALMPPLCTAGYGLAIWNLQYFIGAMYLFTINAIFIALATFIVLKLLNFPMHKYANAARRKRYKLIAAVVGIVVMAPAIYTFVVVFNQNRVSNNLERFVKKEIKELPDLTVIEYEPLYEEKILKISFFNEVPESTVNVWYNQLRNNELYTYISDFTLDIKGSDTKSFNVITTAYNDKKKELENSKNIIEGLQTKITELEKTISDLIAQREQAALNKNQKIVAFSRISKEAKIRYNELERMDFANVLSSKDFIKIDTIPQVTVKWSTFINDSIIDTKEKELRAWLQVQLELDTLFVKRDQPIVLTIPENE